MMLPILTNNFKYYLFILILSLIHPSGQSIMSFQQKFAQGQGDSRNYFENVLDFNYFFDNDLYLFAQFEYSDPPLLGLKTKKLNDVKNIFYLQYSNSKYDLTIGDLYLLHGSGLSLHTYEDQDVDFDNSISGLDFSYHLNDRIDLFTIIGNSNTKSRVDINEVGYDVSINNDVISLGGKLNLNRVSAHYLSLMYNQHYSNDDIESMKSMTNLLGLYLNSINTDKTEHSMTNIDHNYGLHFYFDLIDIYMEQSLVFHDLIFGERVDGYRNYFSTTFNLLDYNIIYEYKDYFTPYLYNVFSAPPVVFRDSASILSSRNLHTIDFTNEYGYQIEFNKSYSNGINLLGTYAYALHHKKAQNNSDSNGFYGNIILDDQFPYKQWYIEISANSKSFKSYYRIGYDYYNEKTVEKNKYVTAHTIPIQYVYNFISGNSLTFYLEMQKKLSEITILGTNGGDYKGDIENKYNYLSSTYSHFGKWSLSLFLDFENDYIVPSSNDNNDLIFISNKGENWYAVDYTKNLKNNAQISIFYGSQKGGLICANGTCVPQPDFKDGFKVTFRTNF